MARQNLFDRQTSKNGSHRISYQAVHKIWHPHDFAFGFGRVVFDKIY
jgi:hypothetical protein